MLKGVAATSPRSKKRYAEGKQYRVGFLCPNGASYIITQWACWMGGNVAVPLGRHQTSDQLEHIIRDADCDLVVAAKTNVDLVRYIN